MKFEVRPVETSKEEKLYTGLEMLDTPGLYEMEGNPDIKYLCIKHVRGRGQLINLNGHESFPRAVDAQYPDTSNNPIYRRITNHQVIITVDD